MQTEFKKNSNSTLSKTLFILSIEVSLFFMIGNLVNVYRFALVGAIYEIVWLPNLALLFSLPLVSLYFLGKEKKKLHSLFFYSIVLLTISILILLINQ
jgi:hypothetical protein